ncbi:MAG: protein phosphatase 2C domain-containing protein [Oscillospiraceae bacterium]|nr:protein phosphatase 2C domain-containing protein [Oscillospiraceae bacterium]
MSILLSGYTRQCASGMHVNQDQFGGLRVQDGNGREIAVAAVADGISLGYEGKYASYNTVLWLLQWAERYFPEHPFDVQETAQEIQEQMMLYNHRLNVFSDHHSSSDTCCTVCGMVTDEEFLLVFNAGDSRLYEMAPSGRVRCMTQDDKAEDGYSIAMHIGGKKDSDLKLTFSSDVYHPDSRYVLCSDGFYKRVDFSAFCRQIMPCRSRAETVSTLEAFSARLAQEGETDDITALILSRSG